MSHYFDQAPAAPSRPARVSLRLPGWEVELAVDRGVFSAAGVDAGTVELLRAGVGPPSPAAAAAGPGQRPGPGDLLDLGCGYGPIAVTLAHRYPTATVWAVDINQRALDLAAANSAALGFDARIRPVRPEDVPDGLEFDGIWSNPPIRVGKPALHELLLSWLPRLSPGGAAWLVVQKHLGADSLASWLGAEGWAVRRVGSRKGYRILEVRRP